MAKSQTMPTAGGGPLKPGKYIQVTLSLPITGDLFKDAKIISSLDTAVTAFRKAIVDAGPPEGWRLENNQITIRGPSTPRGSSASAPAPTSAPQGNGEPEQMDIEDVIEPAAAAPAPAWNSNPAA